MRDLYHCFEQPIARLQPFRCPGYVTYYDLHAFTRRMYIDGRRRTEIHKPFLWVARLHASSAILASDSVALVDCFVDQVDQRIGADSRRDSHLNLVPYPLPGGREIEVLPTNRISVQEGNPPFCRMAIRLPVPRLQQQGAEEPDLHYLTSDPVNLHPVACPYPVSPLSTNQPQSARMKS